ncbi:MAG: type II toxin-antitoxin system RelE/ParE family toxin [Verrucomicrobia bacterium]|nr:type II toxin-antitoxin system RelE/ParE family toxin [Verrucomicrobiota bacterium]MDA1065258.1 type II toxin-antitoxin system RelE/ParE family toxin [Verrucomicrobiota bacterium]
MIQSFRCEETGKVFEGHFSRKLPTNIQKVAHRKLLQLNIADKLGDLRIPPANRLEELRGNRKNQLSIRINQQWRVCFLWKQDGAHQVEIVDYH